MALPLQGSISIDDIRQELGIGGNVDFSLNSAEDGGYVTLNPCSTYKPSSPNPASLSEWYGYDHTQPCVAYEFSAVSCDVSAGICDQAFNSGQANQNTSMYVYTGISFDGDTANDAWYITNASKYTNAYFLLYQPYNGGVSQDKVWEFQGIYSPWNGVANRGTLNGTAVPSGTYFYYIEYNDGSGRTLSGYIFIQRPTTGDIWSSQFSYSAVSSSAACAATNWASYDYGYPVALNKYLFVAGTVAFGSGTPPAAGYYKRRYTSNWYQTDSTGKIIATGTC